MAGHVELDNPYSNDHGAVEMTHSRISATSAGRPRRGFLSRLLRACRGNATVEAALILPVLLTFLMGAIEFGRAYWVQTSLQYAVNNAARCASLASTKCTDVPAYAASQVYGMTIPSNAFTYTAGADCGNSGYAAGYQVSASYTFRTVAARLLPQLGSIALTASACHP